MKAMWTESMHLIKTRNLKSQKASKHKSKESKSNPPSAAVGFTHSGDE
jgi:hypothetical protein